MFKGKTDAFLTETEKVLDKSLKISDIATVDTNNMIILENVGLNPKYYVAEENGLIERLEVKGKFESHNINVSQENWHEVDFADDAKYLWMISPGEQKTDLKLYLYTPEGNLLVEGFKIWKNAHIIDLEGIDLTKKYYLVVECGSLEGTSTIYEFSQMAEGEFKKLSSHLFQTKNSTLLDQREDLSVNWYVMQAKDTEESKIKIKWEGAEIDLEPGPQPMADKGKLFTFAVYTWDVNQNKKVIWEEYTKRRIKGEKELTFNPDHKGQDFFVKIVNYCKADLTLQFDNLDHISIKHYEETEYIRKQLELLVDLYTRDILNEAYFQSWFNLLGFSYSVGNEHYDMLKILLDRKRKALLTWEEFRTYYDELASITDKLGLKVLLFDWHTQEKPGLNKKEFLHYIDNLMGYDADNNEDILKDFLIDQYRKGNLELDSTIQGINRIDEIDVLNTNQVNNFLKDFVVKYFSYSTINEIPIYEDLKKNMSLDVMISLLQTKKVTLDEFVEFCQQKKINLPFWFDKLRILANSIENNSEYKIKKEGEEDIYRKTYKITGDYDSEVYYIQNFLGTLGLYTSWLDGKYGPGTEGSIKSFKTYFNESKYRLPTEDKLDVDGSISKDVISKMLLVYMALERKPEIYFDPSQLTYFSAEKKRRIQEMILEEVRDDYKEDRIKYYKEEKEKTEADAKKLAQTDTDNLTYGGAVNYIFGRKNMMYQFYADSIHYSTHAVPLVVYESLVDKDGRAFKNHRQEKMAISKWELIKTGETNGSLLVQDGDNSIKIFKGTEGIDYLLVDWMTDEEVEIGTLNAHVQGKEEPIISKTLKIQKVDIATNSQDITWDTYILEKVKELKFTGIKLFGKSTRYEPFWDVNNYYWHPKNTFKDLKESSFHKEEGATIFDMVWDNGNLNYSTKVWFYPKGVDIYKDIIGNDVLTEELKIQYVADYLEILLNYGPPLSNRWYNRIYKEYYSQGKEEPELYKLFDPRQYSTVYSKLGTTLNKDAEGDNFSPEKWATLGNLEDLPTVKANFDKLVNLNLVDKAIKYLELYMKYGFNQANNWFNGSKIIDANDPEKVIGKTPLVAQTTISKSYGPMQVMYPYAWNQGYKYDPAKGGVDTAGNTIKPITSVQGGIDLGINHFLLKVRQMIYNEKKYDKKILKYQGEKIIIEPEKWTQFWSELIQRYNGFTGLTYYYAIQIKTREVVRLPNQK